MTFDGYFATEEATARAKFSSASTTINKEVRINKQGSLILGNHKTTVAVGNNTIIYFHQEADADFAAYQLNETAWDGPVNEWSSTSTSTPMYDAISPLVGGVGDIFDYDDNFDTHNMLWTITYNGKVVNVPAGQTPVFDFKFYKVDPDDNETFLFTITGNISTSYSGTAWTATGYPSGQVTTDDRLLMRVYHRSYTPA